MSLLLLQQGQARSVICMKSPKDYHTLTLYTFGRVMPRERTKMKTVIPNQDAIIEEQLRDEDRERDKKWVRDLLNKAEKKLEQAEYDWQSSGGYGTRSSITKYDKEARLCRLALRGLEQGCHRCDLRWRNIRNHREHSRSRKERRFRQDRH